MAEARATEAAATSLGTEMELVVGDMAAGGGCVARAADGRVVFVRHAIPGEKVRVRVLHETARYLRADAVAVLEPAPGRVVAPCAHAGPLRCGGCDWQHIDLALQRQIKSRLVAEQLRRVAGVDWDLEVEEVPDAPSGLGWRTRVRVAIDEEGRAGFRRHRSHDLEVIERCDLAAPAVAALEVAARRWPGAAEVEARAVGGGEESGLISVTSIRARRPREGSHRPARLWRSARAPGTGLVVDGEVVEEPGRQHVVVKGRRFQVSAGSFWQVHVAAPGTLVEAVLEGLAPRAGESAVDLYAGAGLFSAFLAERLGEEGSVLAVERDPGACADAQANTAAFSTVTVMRRAVTERLIARGIGEPDLVVLDPAREGVGISAMRALAGLRPAPRRVAYVSCDPASFARDLRVLRDQRWALEHLRGFDLFPMTEHVELVAFLVPPPS